MGNVILSDSKQYFDDYSSSYKDLIEGQIGFFSKGHKYFSDSKALLLKRLCDVQGLKPNNVLEFGCGIGMNIQSITEKFPLSNVIGYDISMDSLDMARQRHPDIKFVGDGLETGVYDLILVSCVLHHVEVPQRAELIDRLGGLLSERGIVCIVEHNTYNPVTRRMVSTCPFDEDAVLLPITETKKRLDSCSKMTRTNSGFFLFFPEALKFLNRLEPLLKWLPLGGQYYVSARRIV